MAFLDDFTLDYVNRTIRHTSGTTVYTANQMYSALQDQFDELNQMDDPVPMSAQTPTEYTLINGWYMDENSFTFLRGGAIKTDGWDHSIYPTDGIRKLTFTSGWVNLTGTDIGKPIVGSTSSDEGVVIDYDNVNEIIWVRVAASGDDFSTAEEVTITGGTNISGTLTTASAPSGENLWANIYSLGSLAQLDFTLDGAHSGRNTITVNEDIDIHVPQSTYLYVDNGANYDLYTVTSWTGKVFTVSETVGAYAGNTPSYWAPQIYVYQDGSVLTSWWPTGHVDALIKVKDMGAELDGANITVFCRNYSDLYDHFPIDLTAGGRQAVPLATADDLNNQSLPATVAGYADTSIGGSDGATGVSIAFGTYSKDINDGFGSQTYNISIDCGGRRLAQMYEVIKWVTREGSTQTLNSLQGQVYISYNSMWSPVKQSPFGSFAGGTFFGDRGVWIENLHPNDVQAYQLVDSAGTTRNPPNYQNFEVAGLVSGDRVSVFRTTGDNFEINKALFTSTATGNDVTDPTLVVQEAIPSDTPSEGYIRVVAASGSEERYHFSSWSGSTFTLDVTSHPTGLAQTYDDTFTIYVPPIDTEAGVGAIGSTWNSGDSKLYTTVIYAGSDRTVMARVRKKGILPFQTKGSFTASGYSATAIRTTDSIVQ